METRPIPEPSRGLEPVLGLLRRRIRRVLALRGASIAAVTALATLLLLVAVDLRFAPLPPLVRWSLAVAWFAAVAAVVTVAWLRPMLQRLNLVRIARWLETRHPELDERVSTVLEVDRRADSGMSHELLDALAVEAAAGLDAINPRLEVSMRRARRWLWPAAVLATVWGCLFIAWPQWTARHVVRALVPSSKFGTAAGTIVVDPGSVELMEGDPLRVTARHLGGTPNPLEILLHLADGTSSVEPMQEDGGGFFYQLGKATEGFEYEVRAGRETSDRFRVTVWPQPKVVDPRVRLDFPAYTGLAPREQAVGELVSAVAGTSAGFTARLNTPVASARLEIDGTEAGSTSLERSAAGGAVATRWLLAAPGKATARLLLKHRLGREFEALRFTVETVADTPPQVKWIKPAQRELRLRPDDLLEMIYQVEDDFGLAAAGLEVEPDNGEKAGIPQDLPPRAGTSGPPSWRGEIPQAIGALAARWPQARQFKLRVRIGDTRPADLGGPGSGTTPWLVVRIDGGAESLARQEVAAAHSEARETVEEARRLVQQARERIDGRRAELRDGGKVEDYVRKELEEARERFAQARGKLQDLAEKVRDSVHAPKEKELREIAETVERARELLEEAPLQDTAPERDRAAADARDTALQAEQRLGQLRDEIQRAEPRINEYAKLKELEQQQRELARQAEQELAAREEKPPQAPDQQEPADPAAQAPAPQWQQRQQQVAEALRQKTAEQPQARAAALAAQAEQARDLAAEASGQAAEQQAMKDLAQQQAAREQNQAQAADPAARQPAPAPDPAAMQAVREQLGREQAAIQDQVREQLAQAREQQDQETANALPEAAQSAAAAAAAMQQADDPAAAEEARQAARELAAAGDAAQGETGEGPPVGTNDPQEGQTPSGQPPGAMTQGAKTAADLRELARRQEQVAEAIEALQQGNPAEARKQLAELRADKAADLAEAIREAPQVFAAAGVMQQAAQEANQGAQQATQAAQQANPATAANQHGESAARLQQAAEHLAQAATGFAQQAETAKGQAQGDQQAPVPGEPLSEAFQQAAQAADADSKAAAASHAQAAAKALAEAARGTMRGMQGPPGPQGPQADQAQNQMPQPGGSPDESPRARQPDPGVPPELAKLGISADDWERIKSSLKSETGGTAAIALPEEYRDLVRRYFEQMSRSGNNE